MKYPETAEFPYHWLVGHTRSYYSRPHTFLRTYRDEFGRMFRLNLDANPHTYAIFDPHCLEALMLKHKDKLDRGSFMQSQREIWGKGLLISTGALHKQQRAILARAFSQEKMAQYHKTMQTLVREELDQWKSQPSFYPQHYFETISFRLLIATLFGNQMVEPFSRAAQILRYITRLYEPHFTQPSFWIKQKLFPFLKTPVLRLKNREEFDCKKNELMSIFLNEIFPEGKKNTETDSLFSLMLNMRDPQTGERVMSDQQVVDECITFILAGHETITITMLWCMIVLSRTPHEQQALQDEYDRVDLLNLSYKDTMSLKRTQAFIKETLRCYPTVWIFDRYAREPIEYENWRFPRGSRLIISQYVSQRDPEYFKEPDTFRSERWLNGETDNIPMFSYFPFNHGSYGCLGNHFSMMEAAVLLSEMLSRWSVEPFPYEIEECGLMVFMVPVSSPKLTLKPRG